MAENVEHETGDSIPFFPDHVRTEAWVVVGITVLAVIVGAVATSIPVGVGDPADPLNTPLHVKPEWYFLALYQLLKFVPETVGVMIPILGALLVILWPFLDRKQDTKKARRIRAIGVAIFVVVFIVMTIWGELS